MTPEIVDVQAAIQAAWMVDPPFAAELAKRHGLYDSVCLRCAHKPIAAVDPTKVCLKLYGALAYQMCIDCHYATSREGLLAHLFAKTTR